MVSMSDDLLGHRASSDDVVQLLSEPDGDYICCTDLDINVHASEIPEPANRSICSMTDLCD
jgi:hypothetical protein